MGAGELAVERNERAIERLGQRRVPRGIDRLSEESPRRPPTPRYKTIDPRSIRLEPEGESVRGVDHLVVAQ